MNPLWIKTSSKLRLAIIPRPRGGDWLEDEALANKQAGVDILVSMLTSDEADELGLSKEEEACRNAGMSFRNFPVTDKAVPSSYQDALPFVNLLREDLRQGRSVAVQCRASIGRSSILLAAILCLKGYPPEEALELITAARGMQVPDTPEQIAWIKGFAASISA
jgi:protein-tyrosine phosphatase